MDSSMTAKMCLFVNAYHSKYANIHIINNTYAYAMLESEYNTIYKFLEDGINFFDPFYNGDDKVLHIVNKVIGPSVLGRSAWLEDKIKVEERLGLKQYLILASGYDTSGLIHQNLNVFEVDRSEVIDDKLKRLKNIKSNVKYIRSDLRDNFEEKIINEGFDTNKKTLVSLLGLSYYLEKEEFLNLLERILKIINEGSVILFDYPNNIVDEEKGKLKSLASESKEEMKTNYDAKDFISTLERNNAYICEDLTNKEIDKYFYDYNTINIKEPIHAQKSVNYMMIVKK